MLEDVAKGAATAVLDVAPTSYLPVVLIAIMFIIILTGFFILMNKHGEKIFDKSVNAIKEAYIESMKAQNETIKILSKELAAVKKASSNKQS
ncbi:MAG TPA: hypothetical protein H9745_08940 [Candidatus Agathobaculum stercoravium]|nr:hypothetical protein [Candidatus Agathobaculum stercoravium]